MLVCAATNPSIDKLFEVDILRRGDIHRPVAFIARPGGKGLNVSCAAHALGADVVAVALLAGHAGRRVAEMLEAEGIVTDVVDAPGETRSALSVLERATQEMTEFYEAGEPVTAAAWPRFAERVAVRSLDATWLTVSGSLPPGVTAAQVAAVARAGREAGANVAIDLAGEPLAAAIATQPDLVKVNAAEARELTRLDGAAAAEALASLAGGDATIVITLGTEGALMRRPDGSVLRGALDARGAYPTGSGDAFLGGFVACLDAAPDAWTEAFAAGLGAGTANAECPGAAVLDPARARALAEQALGRLARA